MWPPCWRRKHFASRGGGDRSELAVVGKQRAGKRSNAGFAPLANRSQDAHSDCLCSESLTAAPRAEDESLGRVSNEGTRAVAVRSAVIRALAVLVKLPFCG